MIFLLLSRFMQNSDCILEINNLSKRYKLNTEIGSHFLLQDRLLNLLKFNFFKKNTDEIFALKNINLKINRGEVVGVIGLNGAGKSTLLKILSRVTFPTTGNIKIKGKVASLLEVGTGFHTELTGRDNIYLSGTILGMKKKEIDKKFNEIVEFSGVKKYLDMPVKTYSSGMRLRLAFSVTAFLDADILIIDEVLAVGDIEFQKKCIEKLNENIWGRSKTIIFVSHNLESVQSLCSRCILLENGELIADDKTDITIKKYYEKLSQNNFQNLGDRKDRKGDGRIKFTKIELKDDLNRDTEYFYAGKNANFLIEYEVRDKNLQEFDFAFPISIFYSQFRIAHIYTKNLKKTIKVTDKCGVIILKIKNIPFNTGEYFFNVWADDKGDILDWVINAGRFKVVFNDVYNTGLLPSLSQGSILLNYDIVQQQV